MKLPDSEAAFKALKRPKYKECFMCCTPFSKKNTFTMDGWRETQISGSCETCFDELYADFDDERDDDESVI